MIVILTLVISCLWFLPLFFRQGKIDAAPKKYTVFSILLGLTFGIVVGVVFTMTFSSFLDKIGVERGTLLYIFVYALICAGLAEEISKFACGSLFIKLANPIRKLDYMLILGGAGFGFTLTENLLYGLTSGPIAIIRVLLPMHIMWQLRMGAHYFEARKAKAAGDKSLEKKEMFKAFWIPVLFHGFYDFACSLSTRAAMGMDLSAASAGELNLTAGQIIDISVAFVTILFSFVYCIVTEIWAAKIVRKSRALSTPQT